MIERIAENIWVAAPNPGGGNMVVVSTDQGNVAIDTTSYPLFARSVREAVDAVTARPWRFVINTHRHFDHVGGNQAFEECIIIAPEPTREIMDTYTQTWIEGRIAEWEKRGSFERKLLGENFRLVPPQISFTDELGLELGGIKFQALRLGGHTAEQSVVWIPTLGTLVASDLVFNGKLAFVGEGDRWQWMQALEIMKRLGARVVVPGHGDVGDANLLDTQLKELREGRVQT